MDQKGLEFLEQNDFLSVYYHFHAPITKEFEYQNFYYRIYGLNAKTYTFENVPSFGEYFTELGDLYDYVNCLDKRDYLTLHIIKYDSKTNTDLLYDTIDLEKNNMSRKISVYF